MAIDCAKKSFGDIIRFFLGYITYEDEPTVDLHVPNAGTNPSLSPKT